MRLRSVLGAAGMVVAVSWSAMGTFAQASSPQHPADIRVGDCASLGEAVAPLAPLVVPEGDPQGQAGATPVQQSVTEVPLLLEDILSANYSIAVHASPEQVGTPIACGAIGGALADDGSLSVGLQATNGTKISGVASFAPTVAGGGTQVTVLLIDERSGRERGDEGVTSGNDVVDGIEDAMDGTNAPDGVGNMTVEPAPDPARGADAPGITDGTGAVDGTHARDGEPGLTNQPGENGAVDRPRRDSDGGRDSGAARAGEDGSSSG